ncbi:hypothetical protein HDU82_007089 [Entophlyctis luteolus]|nr:hypothetical protein HDU82_007089 [Entophlyctis luteolus]
MSGNTVRKGEWIGTCLIIVGGCIVSIYGNFVIDIDEFPTLLNAMTSRIFILYFTSILFLLVGSICSAVLLELGLTESAEPNETVPDSGSNEGGAYAGLLFAIAGGVSASLTLIIIKCVLDVIAALSLAKVTFTEGVVMLLLIIALIVSVILQLVALNKSIAYLSPLVAVPVFYTFFTSLSVSNTAVMLFSIPDAVLPPDLSKSLWVSAGGVAVIVGGVWLLGAASQKA